MYLADRELETVGSKNVCCAGVLYVLVDQQHVNPSGWPILLQPSACSRLAFLGSTHQVALQATAGNSVSVMVETQDSLQQRICQVSCISCICMKKKKKKDFTSFRQTCMLSSLNSLVHDHNNCINSMNNIYAYH